MTWWVSSKSFYSNRHSFSKKLTIFVHRAEHWLLAVELRMRRSSVVLLFVSLAFGDGRFGSSMLSLNHKIMLAFNSSWFIINNGIWLRLEGTRRNVQILFSTSMRTRKKPPEKESEKRKADENHHFVFADMRTDPFICCWNLAGSSWGLTFKVAFDVRGVGWSDGGGVNLGKTTC